MDFEGSMQRTIWMRTTIVVTCVRSDFYRDSEFKRWLMAKEIQLQQQ